MIFKGVDEEAFVYVNGALAFEHTAKAMNFHIAFLWNNPFCLDLKPYLKPGENQIKVRVVDAGRNGGIYGPVRFLYTNEPFTVEFKSAIDLNPEFENYMKVALKSSLFDRKYKPFSLFWFSDIHGDDIELERLTNFYDYYKEYFDGALMTGDIIENTSLVSKLDFGQTHKVPKI